MIWQTQQVNARRGRNEAQKMWMEMEVDALYTYALSALAALHAVCDEVKPLVTNRENNNRRRVQKEKEKKNCI